VTVREVVATAYRGALPALVVSAVGGLLAGGILNGMTAELREVRGLLVMVPAFLAIRGSVYGSLGSRLSSGLHQGLIEPRLTLDGRVRSAVGAALLNGAAASLLAGGGTVVLLTALGRPVAPARILTVIALLGAFLAGIVLAALIVSVVIAGYRRGLDPDNLIGPIVTTAGDIFGMAALLAATRLVLAVA